MITQHSYHKICLERDISFCKSTPIIFLLKMVSIRGLVLHCNWWENSTPASKELKEKPQQLMTAASAVQIREDKPSEYVGLFACSLCCNS